MALAGGRAQTYVFVSFTCLALKQSGRRDVLQTCLRISLGEETKMLQVSASPLVKTYCLDEFWQLPEPSDRSKLEPIAGVLYMTRPPG